MTETGKRFLLPKHFPFFPDQKDSSGADKPKRSGSLDQKEALHSAGLLLAKCSVFSGLLRRSASVWIVRFGKRFVGPGLSRPKCSLGLTQSKRFVPPDLPGAKRLPLFPQRQAEPGAPIREALPPAEALRLAPAEALRLGLRSSGGRGSAEVPIGFERGRAAEPEQSAGAAKRFPREGAEQLKPIPPAEALPFLPQPGQILAPRPGTGIGKALHSGNEAERSKWTPQPEALRWARPERSASLLSGFLN